MPIGATLTDAEEVTLIAIISAPGFEGEPCEYFRSMADLAHAAGVPVDGVESHIAECWREHDVTDLWDGIEVKYFDGNAVMVAERKDGDLAVRLFEPPACWKARQRLDVSELRRMWSLEAE